MVRGGKTFESMVIEVFRVNGEGESPESMLRVESRVNGEGK